VALNASVANSARIVGPSVAGLTVAWIGEAGCFFINGVTYLAVILALLAIRLSPQAVPKTRLKVAGSMVAGFRYVWGTQTVWALMTIVAVSSFFTLSYVAMTTVFAQDVLQAGSSGLGFLMTAMGGRAMIGALLVANIQVGRRGKWLILGNLLGPAVLVLFCLSRSLPLSLALIAIVAANSSVRQTLANSLIQIATPEEYQGRVMSIFNLLFHGMSRVGVLGVGGLAEIVGVAWAVGLGAAVSLIWGLIVIWRMPYVHRLPRTTEGDQVRGTR
jgi:MFS family permease